MEAPEVNLARHLVAKLALSPPVDIESLVRKYAGLAFAEIPVSHVDGVSLDLKVLGKSPRVIVNSGNPVTRQRFTLGHELGHILIPWHLGSIIDTIDPVEAASSNNYTDLEQEANAFAAEVLMPRAWIDELLAGTDDLASAHKQVAKVCETSPLAAAIRLSGMLPAGVIYACENDGKVQFAGRSIGTIASALQWGVPMNSHQYAYASKHFEAQYGKSRLHWWTLPSTVEIDAQDIRSWREILEGIVADTCPSDVSAATFRQSINGVAGHANSLAKRSKNYTPESVASACIQRFKSSDKFASVVSHADFDAYVYKRAAAFFQ